MDDSLVCQYTEQNITSQYMTENHLTYTELYSSPESLFHHVCAMEPKMRLFCLPVDYYLQAELFGIELSGYDDCSFLFPKTVPFEKKCPEFSLDHPRLRVILNTFDLARSEGYTPCFNISGFADIFGALYGSTLFYAEWYNSRSYINELFSYMQECLFQLIDHVAGHRVLVFSFVESTLLLPLIGKQFAREYSKEVLTPCLKGLQESSRRIIFHICQLTTTLIEQNPAVGSIRRELSEPLSSEETLIKLANAADRPVLVGKSCLHNPKKTYFYYELTL